MRALRRLRLVALRLGPVSASPSERAPRAAARRHPQLGLELREAGPRPGRALPVLDERLRGTRFVAHEARSVLNPPAQTGMDFWSLNPYVGCEFGCSYCYARYAHRYVVERAHAAGALGDAELPDYRGAEGWEAFERRIFVKANLAAALERDLARYARVALPPAVRAAEPIVIGTATDPYQPAERSYRLTRAALERLARCEGLSVGIITKSPLVTRDVDVLRRVAVHNDLEIYISLISLDARLVRRFEMRSPHPRARLRALARLAAAGLHAGLIVAPVLPGITDGTPALDALFGAARDAGARFVTVSPLRLYAAVRARFAPLLARERPALAPRYRAAYARGANPPREYAEALTARVRALRAKHGFGQMRMQDRYATRTRAPQLDLEM